MYFQCLFIQSLVPEGNIVIKKLNVDMKKQ